MRFLGASMLVTLLWGISANAQQSTLSTGDYHTDLAHVRTAIRGITWLKEICADSFPSFTNQNDEAYRTWRKKHLRFLQEIERYSQESLVLESQGDPAKSVEIRLAEEKRFLQYKELLRKQFSDAGTDKSREVCRQYPDYLHKSARGNIEYFYAEQVATIRQGQRPLRRK